MLIFGHSSLGTHRVSIGFLTRFHKGTMSVRIDWMPSPDKPASWATSSPALVVPGRARPMARRLSANCKQSGLGCSHAPRPGIRRRKSTSASGSPDSLADLASRTSCSRAAVCLQPMQVRTGAVKSGAEPPAFSAFFTNCSMPYTFASQTALRHGRYQSSAPECRYLFSGCVGVDVNAPSCELGGQAGVLPLLANGEGQLVIGNHHAGRACRLVHDGD